MKFRSAHLYNDDRVTPERVAAFAGASRDEQLKVLAELRRRSVDDINDVQISIMVAAFGALSVLFVAPGLSTHVLKAGTSAWAVELAAAIAAGAVVGIVLLPIIVFAVLNSRRRERATIWLRAYEDEIQRRWLQPGWRARVWRRNH